MLFLTFFDNEENQIIVPAVQCIIKRKKGESTCVEVIGENETFENAQSLKLVEDSYFKDLTTKKKMPPHRVDQTERVPRRPPQGNRVYPPQDRQI